MEDIYNSRDRVWLIFMWALASNLGLIIGPIMSAHITEYLGWYFFLPSSDHRADPPQAMGISCRRNSHWCLDFTFVCHSRVTALARVGP